MGLAGLFFSFEGRIARTHFWLGIVIIAAVELALLWVMGALDSTPQLDRWTGIVTGVVELVTIYPTAAITVKRLHDRNQPGSYVWVLIAISFITAAMDFFGVPEEPRRAGIVFWMFSAAVLVIALAFLIELGFRRGTPGDNRFGPDPLAGRA